MKIGDLEKISEEIKVVRPSFNEGMFLNSVGTKNGQAWFTPNFNVWNTGASKNFWLMEKPTTLWRYFSTASILKKMRRAIFS